MKQEGLLYFTDTYLTTLGLLIFFAFFVSMLFWVSRPYNKKKFKHLEQMPIEKGTSNE